jgi:acetyl esterase/lipase
MTGFLTFLSLLAMVALVSPSATAQMSANPPEVGAKIKAMGARLNRDIVITTAKLYAPLLAAAPKTGVKVTLDQSYGPDARNRLDVYQPQARAKRGSPIVVFLHGGGFVRGDKKRQDNVGIWFARHGVVGIMANYRFAPKNTWPSGAEDIASMIKWVKSNARRIGGNAQRIFLMGTSAGAGHVASYVFFERFHLNNDGVAGAILVSGPTYDLSLNLGRDGKQLSHSGELAYFGADISKLEDMSSIRNVHGRKIPVFIAYAEFDMPLIQRQNMVLIEALYKRDKMLPTVKQVIGHNHISITRHFNTKDESLGPDVLEFIRLR